MSKQNRDNIDEKLKKIRIRYNRKVLKQIIKKK